MRVRKRIVERDWTLPDSAVPMLQWLNDAVMTPEEVAVAKEEGRIPNFKPQGYSVSMKDAPPGDWGTRRR